MRMSSRLQDPLRRLSITTTSSRSPRRCLSSWTAWMEETVLQRPNPFLDDDKSSPERIPWRRMKPHHAPKARQRVLADYQAALQSTPDEDITTLSRLQSHWQNDVQGPVNFVQQTLTVMSLTGAVAPAEFVAWQSAFRAWQTQRAAVWQRGVVGEEADEGPAVTRWLFHNVPDNALNDEDEDTDDASLRQRQWLRYWQRQTGATLLDTATEQQRRRAACWRQWTTALYDVAQAWHESTPSPKQSRTWLPLLYGHLGSTQALAREAWQQPHALQHALQMQFARYEHIVHLLEAVETRVVPHVALASEAAARQPPPASQSRQQPPPPLTRRRMVTLDAAMMILQQICVDVFNVKLTWHDKGKTKASATAWHPDVTCLTVSTLGGDDDDGDEDGSTVYLDLLARPGSKTTMSAMIPVTPRVSVVSLALEPPVWDTDATLLSFYQVLELFHEVGHVLQHHCGGGADPSWPADWAEVLPHFMEQWLWEPSTLKGLLTASGVELDQEMVDTLYQQARRQKAQTLAEQAWYAALECELFTDKYNVQNADETIMAVAQRLARRYVPHDVPHPTDLSALYQLAVAHVGEGQPPTLYRYLWAEAVAAHVFEHTRLAYESSSSMASSPDAAEARKALQRHVVQPTRWSAMCLAFGMTEDQVPLDSLWKRYRLD